MISKNNYKSGFTLLELMIVMVILGVLAALISGNFLNSLKKGRDARRKADLEQMTRANEMYYEDYGVYVTTAAAFYGSNSQFCAPASDGGCAKKIYMLKVPKDPRFSCQYDVDPIGTKGYGIYTMLENDKDTGQNVKQSGWSNDSSCCGSYLCKYVVTSPNVVPP